MNTIKKKKILNKIFEQEDFDADEIISLEVEPEDRSVGIFGSIFTLGFKNNTTNKTLWVDMPDDVFVSLLDKLKPEMKSREEQDRMDKEMADEWEKEHENETK